MRRDHASAVDAGRRIGKSLNGKKGESVRSIFKATGVVAVAAAAVLTFVPVAAANPSKVLASDACSPSFNELFMDPTICTRNGGTPVEVFLQQLQQNKFAGAWHFSPKRVNVNAGDSLTVENRGGETHTFSEVSRFRGGGIVPQLNEILFGTPTHQRSSSRTPRAAHQLHSGGGPDHDRPEHADAGDAPVHLRDPPVDGGHGRRPLTGDDTPHSTGKSPSQLVRPRVKPHQHAEGFFSSSGATISTSELRIAIVVQGGHLTALARLASALDEHPASRQPRESPSLQGGERQPGVGTARRLVVVPCEGLARMFPPGATGRWDWVPEGFGRRRAP